MVKNLKNGIFDKNLRNGIFDKNLENVFFAVKSQKSKNFEANLSMTPLKLKIQLPE